MAVATYSRNPVVSAAVFAAATTTSTVYTCPANSYAIINLSIETNTSGAYFCIGTSNTTGVKYFAGATVNRSNIPGFADPNGSAGLSQYTGTVCNIVVGPGQSVYFVVAAASTGYINGVQFTNS